MGPLGTCYYVLAHKNTGQWLHCVFGGTHTSWTSHWMARDWKKLNNELTEVLQRLFLICSFQTSLRNYLLIVPEMCQVWVQLFWNLLSEGFVTWSGKKLTFCMCDVVTDMLSCRCACMYFNMLTARSSTFHATTPSSGCVLMGAVSIVHD